MRKEGLILLVLILLYACGDQPKEKQRRPSTLNKYVYSEIRFKEDFQFAVLHSRMDCSAVKEYGVMPVEVNNFRPELARADNFGRYVQVTFCSHCFTESLYDQFLEAGYDMYECKDDSLR